MIRLLFFADAKPARARLELVVWRDGRLPLGLAITVFVTCALAALLHRNGMFGFARRLKTQSA